MSYGGVNEGIFDYAKEKNVSEIEKDSLNKIISENIQKYLIGSIKITAHASDKCLRIFT